MILLNELTKGDLIIYEDENDKIDEALSLEFVGGELNEILDEFMLLALSPNCDLFISQNWSILY